MQRTVPLRTAPYEYHVTCTSFWNAQEVFDTSDRTAYTIGSERVAKVDEAGCSQFRTCQVRMLRRTYVQVMSE